MIAYWQGQARSRYNGFATTQTLAQALRPFPQFGNINYRRAPLGRTWYDSLQVKATKRFSHGIDSVGTFTWAKELMMGSEAEGTFADAGAVNDVFQRNTTPTSTSQPWI